MKHKTDIDIMLQHMEEIIDVRDDMHEEEQNCNYRYLETLRNEKYLPAREAMKEAFKEAVEEVVEDSIRTKNNYIRTLLQSAIDEEIRKVMKSKFY